MTIRDWLGFGAIAVLIGFMWFAFRRASGVKRGSGLTEGQGPEHSTHHHGGGAGGAD